ncbi:MAG: hypothetical protein P1U63_04160 [Coxiellaceae bacterium]|nr:hypothetical protein [Coxiellaceae bacterium]
MGKFTRPSGVTTAIQLLYITLIISFVCGIINVIQIHGNPAGAPAGLGIGPMVAILIISLAIFWFLFFHISRGRNWARIIYLILFVLGILSTGWHLKMYLQQGMLISLATLVNYVLGVVAIVLLFTSESNTWFKTPNKPTNAPEDNDETNPS